MTFFSPKELLLMLTSDSLSFYLQRFVSPCMCPLHLPGRLIFLLEFHSVLFTYIFARSKYTWVMFGVESYLQGSALAGAKTQGERRKKKGCRLALALQYLLWQLKRLKRKDRAAGPCWQQCLWSLQQGHRPSYVCGSTPKRGSRWTECPRAALS